MKFRSKFTCSARCPRAVRVHVITLFGTSFQICGSRINKFRAVLRPATNWNARSFFVARDVACAASAPLTWCEGGGWDGDFQRGCPLPHEARADHQRDDRIVAGNAFADAIGFEEAIVELSLIHI